MRAKDYRKNAWGKLKGNWTTMVIAYIIMGLILGAVSFTGIGALLLTGPLTLGFSIMTLKVVRGEKPAIENLFNGISDFARSTILFIVKTIIEGLWALLFVIPGIIATYRHAMCFYILKDNPEMEALDARRASKEMMKGHKWQLFCLHFSFIGWILLSFLTFGILFFWVMPYMETANAEFYENLKNNG